MNSQFFIMFPELAPCSLEANFTSQLSVMAADGERRWWCRTLGSSPLRRWRSKPSTRHSFRRFGESHGDATQWSSTSSAWRIIPRWSSHPGDRKSVSVTGALQHLYVGELSPEPLGPGMIRGMILQVDKGLNPININTPAPAEVYFWVYR